jgi:hypothetical protein
MSRDRHFATLGAVAAVYIVVVGGAALISRNASVTALVAAVGTALIIAWQSLETARAARAAEEGLRGATDSLLVSQVLAVEAERRRLDAAGPMLTVRINVPEWPPRGARLFVGSEPEQLDEGRVFRLPREGPNHMTLRADGYVRNEGARTVTISLLNLCVEHLAEGAMNLVFGEPGNHEVDLQPDQPVRFRLQDERMAAEWVANAEAAARKSQPPNAAIGTVVAKDDFDNGVIDTWEIELGGYPLERMPDEAGSWRVPHCLPQNVPIHAVVRPRVRRYFRSKARNQELPQVELPPLARPAGGERVAGRPAA